MNQPIRTGGAFDPADRPIFFGAASPGDATPKYYLVAVNDLPGKADEAFLDRILDEGHTVLLDSGIFNLTNQYKRDTGCHMDEALALAPQQIPGFEALFERYCHLTTMFGDRLWGYIELDQGGAVNKRRTRATLHDRDLSPIPVYHPLVDGWDYFDELAQSYDRICFGNVVQANIRTRLALMHTLWERHRAYPDLWVHVLGLTANEWCLPMPPDSCDSSSWLNGLRYPALDLGYTQMKNTPRISQDRFRYDRDHAPNGTPANRDHYMRTARIYADEMWFQNETWRRILADEAATFGITDRFPPLHDTEDTPSPRSTE